MNPALIVGISAFGCSFGGALFGMLLGKLLPEQQLSEESKRVSRRLAITGLILAFRKRSSAQKQRPVPAATRHHKASIHCGGARELRRHVERHRHMTKDRKRTAWTAGRVCETKA